MIASEAEAREFVSARCDAAAMTRLGRLNELLIIENARQNLVSNSSLGSVWQRHIADSAQLLDHVSRETGKWLDLGTGAGFPGLVIAAMRPERTVLLVESRARRIEWLRKVIADLELPHCSVAGQRLEIVATDRVSIISARAFAPLPRLIDLARRFSTSDTLWLLPKGRSAAQEVAELPRKLREGFHVEQSATDPDAGIVVGHIAEAKRE